LYIVHVGQKRPQAIGWNDFGILMFYVNLTLLSYLEEHCHKKKKDIEHPSYFLIFLSLIKGSLDQVDSLIIKYVKQIGVSSQVLKIIIYVNVITPTKVWVSHCMDIHS